MKNVLSETRYGHMYTMECDGIIGESIRRYGEWAEQEIHLLRQVVRRDSVVVDVGANIGTHTVALAPLAYHVIAFEPQHRVFQLLCANVVANNLTNVTARNAAVGSSCSTCTFQALDFDKADNNIGAARVSDGGGCPTQMVSIDSLDLRHCDLIKADIEGYELEMLHGATETLRRCKPILYLEAHANRKQIETLLDGLGYKLYVHKTKPFNPDNWSKDQENFFPRFGDPEYAEESLLCVHSSTKVRFAANEI